MKASVRDVLRRLGMVLAGASTLVVALVLTMAIRASRRYKRLKLPGPPDHLLLGSAAQLKKIADSVTNDEGLGRLVLFSELRRLYGDVVKMRLGLDTYVLINSREALRTVGKWPKAEQYERLQIVSHFSKPPNISMYSTNPKNHTKNSCGAGACSFSMVPSGRSTGR